MNAKAKQRTAATGIGRKIEPEIVVEAPHAPTPPTVGLDLPGGAHEFAVEPHHKGERLDRFLTACLAGYAGLSRTRIQGLIADGHVAVDGIVARQAGFKLDKALSVWLDMPEPVPAEPKPQAIPLNVLFEDAHLLILDKPAGLVVHPAAGHEDGTLVNALLAHCGDSLSGIGGVKRPGIVHRLDKETSGLMVVAKTDAAHQGLADLFADHGRSGSLRRAYRAFVWGVPLGRSGMVDLPLGRHAHHREKVAVVSEERGRHAVTHWSLLDSFGDLASEVECVLETGRTHQIRVHMTELGHPLIGDPVYGTGFKTKVTRLPPTAGEAVRALNRQALHAVVLGFVHPVTGEELLFESALPDDLARLKSALAAG